MTTCSIILPSVSTMYVFLWLSLNENITPEHRKIFRVIILPRLIKEWKDNVLWNISLPHLIKWNVFIIKFFTRKPQSWKDFNYIQLYLDFPLDYVVHRIFYSLSLTLSLKEKWIVKTIYLYIVKTICIYK